MSDHLKAVKAWFTKDAFAATSGVELIEVRPGFAQARLAIEPRHLNSVGIVQGGAIFTLADFAFAVACNTSGQVTVAVNMNLSCVKATSSGILFAEAVEVSRSRKISNCTVRVTEETGDLVAIFQGTAYIKKDVFPPQA
jgi:acyl-CoA thioesterase